MEHIENAVDAFLQDYFASFYGEGFLFYGSM